MKRTGKGRYSIGPKTKIQLVGTPLQHKRAKFYADRAGQFMSTYIWQAVEERNAREQDKSKEVSA